MQFLRTGTTPHPGTLRFHLARALRGLWMLSDGLTELTSAIRLDKAGLRCGLQMGWVSEP